MVDAQHRTARLIADLALVMNVEAKNTRHRHDEIMRTIIAHGAISRYSAPADDAGSADPLRGRIEVPLQGEDSAKIVLPGFGSVEIHKKQIAPLLLRAAKIFFTLALAGAGWIYHLITESQHHHESPQIERHREESK